MKGILIVKSPFFLGIVNVQLLFGGCRTLKDRRGLLSSLKARLSNAGFAVAQTGPPDMVKTAWIAAVCVCGTETGTKRMLTLAEKLLHNPQWELSELYMDIVSNDELSLI